MTTLRAGLALRAALEHVRDIGCAVLEEALTKVGREAIIREVASGTYERVPPEIGPVRQDTELLLMTGELTDAPAISVLRQELVDAVRAQAPEGTGLRDWWPNEAYVQRYEAGALGVTAHVDSQRFVLLVAIFTLFGSSEFMVCEGRSGGVVEKWATRPGTLVLLRGPRLGGIENGRPFHAVGGPAEGQRYSLTFRMNASTA